MTDAQAAENELRNFSTYSTAQLGTKILIKIVLANQTFLYQVSNAFSTFEF